MVDKGISFPKINMSNNFIEDTIKKGTVVELKNLLRNNKCLNTKNNLNQTPLILAIKYYKLEMIEAIIDSGANLDLCDNEGNTALIISSKLDRVDIIKILLDANANFNIKNKDGETALDIAKRFGNKSSITALCGGKTTKRSYKLFTDFGE